MDTMLTNRPVPLKEPRSIIIANPGNHLNPKCPACCFFLLPARGTLRGGNFQQPTFCTSTAFLSLGHLPLACAVIVYRLRGASGVRGGLAATCKMLHSLCSGEGSCSLHPRRTFCSVVGNVPIVWESLFTYTGF